MHNHTDKVCKHILKECKECGNIYCTKCNKEWYRNYYPNTWYYSGNTTSVLGNNPCSTPTSANIPIHDHV